jgi:2-methylisocitrate lyase-like PEP mutase family enzyme
VARGIFKAREIDDPGETVTQQIAPYLQSTGKYFQATMEGNNRTAEELKALHQPGRPLILANVYDFLSAQAVGSLPSCKALANASYAVARANGTEDDDMDLETNLGSVRYIAAAAKQLKKPLTVDIQDAYSDQLEEAITRLIQLGVVGVNLEDCDKATQKMHDVEEATRRVKRALAAASKEGVPDFVVNARCDTLIHGGSLDEVIKRGHAYLNAGATTVFVWGGSKRGVSWQEVERLVKEFGGKLNVALKMTPDGLSIPQLADIGVARISMGPALQFKAFELYANEAEKLLKQGKWARSISRWLIEAQLSGAAGRFYKKNRHCLRCLSKLLNNCC